MFTNTQQNTSVGRPADILLRYVLLTHICSFMCELFNSNFFSCSGKRRNDALLYAMSSFRGVLSLLKFRPRLSNSTCALESRLQNGWGAEGIVVVGSVTALLGVEHSLCSKLWSIRDKSQQKSDQLFRVLNKAHEVASRHACEKVATTFSVLETSACQNSCQQISFTFFLACAKRRQKLNF